MKLITHLHLVLRLTMSAATSPIPLYTFMAHIRMTLPNVYRGMQKHIEFWWGSVKKTYHLKDPGINGRIICMFRKQDWMV
jgi:hypothetical protein